MDYGFVYVLGNNAMPDVYKVGCTERSPSKRADELSSGTGVPDPFQVICYGEFSNFQEVERGIHVILANRRLNGSREFFSGPLEEIVDQLRYAYGDKLLNFCEGESAFLIHREQEKEEERFKQHLFFTQNADPIFWPDSQTFKGLE